MQSEAHFHLVPVDVPFTKDGFLGTNPVRLRIDGDDAWLPEQLYVFGLDTPTGRPRAIVPLAHVPQWTFGSLSTDPTDFGGSSQSTITLPFLP
jgi:hypothetical protein